MKTVRLLYEQHGVESLDGVRRMVEDGSLAKAKGISEKTVDSIGVVLDLTTTFTKERWPWRKRLKVLRVLHLGYGVRSVDDILRIIENGTLAPNRVEGIGTGEYTTILEVLGIDY